MPWNMFPSQRTHIPISDPLNRANNSSLRLLLTHPLSCRWLHQPTGSLCFAENFFISSCSLYCISSYYTGLLLWQWGEMLLKGLLWVLFALRHRFILADLCASLSSHLPGRGISIEGECLCPFIKRTGNLDGSSYLWPRSINTTLSRT